MPKSRKVKIDDYIKKKTKEHEDEDYIKGVAFQTVKKISEKDSMPVYNTPPSEPKKEGLDDENSESSEEE